MQRVLTFGDTSTDKIRFRLLWDGFTLGSQVERVKLQREQKQQSREDRKAEVRLKLALLSVSIPIESSEIPAPKEDDVSDRRPRMLNGGGEIFIDQSDFSRLLRYVEQTPWLVDVVEHASDLEDWLDAAEKREKEHAQEVSKHEKKRDKHSSEGA